MPFLYRHVPSPSIPPVPVHDERNMLRHRPGGESFNQAPSKVRRRRVVGAVRERGRSTKNAEMKSGGGQTIGSVTPVFAQAARLLTSCPADSHHLLSHDRPHLAIEFLPPLIFRPSYNHTGTWPTQAWLQYYYGNEKGREKEEGINKRRTFDMNSRRFCPVTNDGREAVARLP